LPILPKNAKENYNCVDAQGRKQGWWIVIEEPGEIFESNSDDIKVVNNPDYSFGQFLNDKKIGVWNYIQHGGCYALETKTARYSENGSVVVIEGDESRPSSITTYSADSSSIISLIPLMSDTIKIKCTKGKTPDSLDSEITIRGNVIKRFNIIQFEFEKSRVEAGMYYRAIQMNNNISH
jgi:hypothetical protein